MVTDHTPHYSYLELCSPKWTSLRASILSADQRHHLKKQALEIANQTHELEKIVRHLMSNANLIDVDSDIYRWLTGTLLPSLAQMES